MKKIAIITGTSRGFGLEVAKYLVEQKYFVIGISRTRGELESSENFRFLKCDLSNNKEVVEVIKKIKEDYSHIDLLINNAGTDYGVGKIEEISIDDWNYVMNVNLLSAINITTNLINLIKNSKNGKIINVCSLGANKPLKLLSPYCTSKAALKHFSLCLANELMEYNITVNSIGINANTDLVWSHAKQKLKCNYNKSYNSLTNNGMPDVTENLELIKFLISEESKYITGQYIEAHSMGYATW